MTLEEIALRRYQFAVLDYMTNFQTDDVTEIDLFTSICDCELAYNLAQS